MQIFVIIGGFALFLKGMSFIANYGRIKSKIALRPRFSFACILHIAEPIILFIIELIMLKSMA